MSQYYDLYINGKIGTMQDINAGTNVTNEQIKNKPLNWVLRLVTEYHRNIPYGKLPDGATLVKMEERKRYNINGKSFVLIPSKQADVNVEKSLEVARGESAAETSEDYNGIMYGIMERLSNGGVEYVGRSREEKIIKRKLVELGVGEIKDLELDTDYHVYEYEEDEDTGDVVQVSDDPIRTFFVFKVEHAKDFEAKKLQLRNHIRTNALDIAAKMEKERLRAAENRKKKRLESQTGDIDLADSAHTKTLNNISKAFNDGTELVVRNGAFKSNPIKIKNGTAGANLHQVGLILIKNGVPPTQIMTFNHNIVAYKDKEGDIRYTEFFPDSTVWETIKLKLNAKPM